MMKDQDVNHIENIEDLQKKIEYYKETLHALNNQDTTDELNRLNMKINDIEQSITEVYQQQKIELEKYVMEVSMLTEQLNTLHQTVYELTEKVSTFIEEKSQMESKTKHSTQPSTPTTSIPSFQQLQQLLTDAPPIEHAPPKRNETKEIQNNHFPIASQINKPNTRSRQSMHHLNRPSAQKKFSVTLDSANVSPFQNDVNSSPVADNPPVVENPSIVESFAKEELLVEEPFSEPAPMQSKETPSILNFFRKR